MQATGYSVQCQASTRALKGKKDIEGGQLEVTIQLHMYNTVYRDDDAEKKKKEKKKKVIHDIIFHHITRDTSRKMASSNDNKPPSSQYPQTKQFQKIVN